MGDGRQGLCGTCPALIRTGSTRSTERVAATTGPGSHLGSEREKVLGAETSAGPAHLNPAPAFVPRAHTHWEPGAAGPPGAEPLGIGSGWRTRALWREDERAVSAPMEHRLPLPPHCAYLWLWGSPENSGLFSPSGGWGGWWAPEAGTEVAGSLVALQGDRGVSVTDALTSQGPWEPPSSRGTAGQCPAPALSDPTQSSHTKAARELCAPGPCKRGQPGTSPLPPQKLAF